MEIYIAKNKTRMGPYDIGQIKQMLDTGLIEKHDLYWHEGMLDWAPAASLSHKNSNKEQGINSGQQNYTPQQFQYQSGNTNYPLPNQTVGSEPMSTWALVLGLLGLLCTGIICGIPAIICGHMSLSTIAKHPHLKGKGAATAGLILGYIGSIFWIIFGISLIKH